MSQLQPPSRFRAAALVAVALVAGGCGSDGPDRFSLSGNIRYGDQPIPAGRIVFEPDKSQGNLGPQGIAEIHDGYYRTLSRRGSIAGPVHVTIYGHSGVPHPEDPLGLPLFPAYRLTIEIERDSNLDLVVPAEHTFATKP